MLHEDSTRNKFYFLLKQLLIISLLHFFIIIRRGLSYAYRAFNNKVQRNSRIDIANSENARQNISLEQIERPLSSDLTPQRNSLCSSIFVREGEEGEGEGVGKEREKGRKKWSERKCASRKIRPCQELLRAGKQRRERARGGLFAGGASRDLFPERLTALRLPTVRVIHRPLTGIILSTYANGMRLARSCRVSRDRDARPGG